MLEKLCNRQKTKPERNFTSHTQTHTPTFATHTPSPGHTHTHTHIPAHKHVRVLTQITTHFLVRAGDDSREKRKQLIIYLRENKSAKSQQEKKCIYSLNTQTHARKKGLKNIVTHTRVEKEGSRRDAEGSILSGFATAYFFPGITQTATHHKWSKTGRTFQRGHHHLFSAVRAKSKAKKKQTKKR